MENLDSSIQLHLMPARDCGGEFGELYTSAFSCWMGVWLETFRELTSRDRFFSDDFTRHDEIVALFRGAKCLGLVLLRTEKFSNPAIWEDSYFSSWPRFLVNRLSKFGDKFSIVSYLTGSQDERGKPVIGNLKMQEVLVACASLRFLEHGTNIMVGTPRIEVGSGKSCAMAGGTRIFMGQKMHGVDIECVQFTRDSVAGTEFSPLITSLWNHRLYHGGIQPAGSVLSSELNQNSYQLIGG